VKLGDVRGLVRSGRRFLGPKVVRWLVVGATAGIVLGIAELAIAMFLQLFLQTLGATSSAPMAGLPFAVDIRALAGALLVIGTVRAIGQYMASQASSETMNGLGARLRRLALHRMIARDDARFVPASEVTTQLVDTFPKAATAVSYGAALVGATFQASVLAVLLLVTSTGEAVAGLLGLGLVGLLVLRINRSVRARAAQIPGEQSAINQGIQRVARSFVLVRVLRTEAREHARLAGAVESVASHARGASRLASLAYAATPFLGTLLLTAIIVLSQEVFETPAVRLVAFLYLFVRFVQVLASITHTFSMLSQSWPQLALSFRFVERIEPEGLRAALAPVAAVPSSEGAALRSIDPPSVELRDVRFRYEGSDRDVIDGLSLTVRPGEQIAIVGPSGCGKSTLLLLILGFLREQRGQVMVSGVAPRAYFGEASHRIGYVGTEAFLIAGTLRENLLYGNTVAPSEERIWAALEAARLRGVVERLPEKLELRLTENGAGLSAGEQQRLCLARALLNEPALLILDEPSANLDARTEEEIVDAVRAFGAKCTTILVSHRPGMLKHADRVVDLGAPLRAA
jgi:ABC-type multidrug transport system fused ATPase/permease subunit